MKAPLFIHSLVERSILFPQASSHEDSSNTHLCTGFNFDVSFHFSRIIN